MIVFGHNNFRIKSITPAQLGLTDESWSGITFEIRQRYFHLFWIPFFSIGKLYGIKKPGDDSLYEMPAEIKQVIESNFKVGTPWYTFFLLWAALAGGAVAGIGGVISDYQNKERWAEQQEQRKVENKETKQFIVDNQKGLQARISTIDELRSIADTLSISDDTLFKYDAEQIVFPESYGDDKYNALIVNALDSGITAGSFPTDNEKLLGKVISFAGDTSIVGTTYDHLNTEDLQQFMGSKYLFCISKLLQMNPEVANSEEFKGGLYFGKVVVFDVEKKTPIHSFTVMAENSDNVYYTGSTNFQAKVQDDLDYNIKKSIRDGVKKHFNVSNSIDL